MTLQSDTATNLLEAVDYVAVPLSQHYSYDLLFDGDLHALMPGLRNFVQVGDLTNQ